MVLILSVELGRPILSAELTTPTTDLIRMAAKATGKTDESELLLLTSDGRLIEKGKVLREFIEEPTELFAISSRKPSFEHCGLMGEGDWRKFAFFPPHDAYEDPFPFEDTDVHWEKDIVEDEKLMFVLTNRARRAYALYSTYLKACDSEAEKLEMRVKACGAMLKNVKRYRKKVKEEFAKVRGRLEGVKKDTGMDASSFKPRLMALAEREDLAPYVQQLLKDPSFKNLGKSFGSSLRSLESKLSDIETLLEDSKKSLRGQSSRNKSRLTSLSKFLSKYFTAGIREKESELTRGLAVCGEYRKLRVSLYQAVKSGGTRMDIGDLRDTLDEWQDTIEDSEHLVIDLQEWSRHEQDESLKVHTLFREVARECAIQSNKLKLRGLEKLRKIEGKTEKLWENRGILAFPVRFPESCEAAISEVERRSLVNKRLADMYAELCHHIVTEEQRRGEFYRMHGELLPTGVFSELEEAGVARRVLRHLLKIEQAESGEEAKAIGETDAQFKATILHYESELSHADSRLLSDKSALESKYTHLSKEVKTLSTQLFRLNSEKQELQSLLNSYAVELGLLREEAANKQPAVLRMEVEKLQKKEAVFKETWIEQVQSLESEVKFLKSRERKKSRAEMGDLPC